MTGGIRRPGDLARADTLVRNRVAEFRAKVAEFRARPLLESDPNHLVGSMLADRYMIIERIGEGGMGSVYLAEDTKIGKRVAVKVLPKDLAGRPTVSARFVQEAKVSPRIEHENVIDVTDLGTTPEGVPFFVMEYLRGSDLYQAISGGGMGWGRRSADIMLQVCRALSAAHEKGIIHRDMKPENVFLPERSDGKVFVKLLDFGIAKLLEQAHVLEERDDGKVVVASARMTQAGMVMGTPSYMAPEQAKGQEIDHRVDVYAVGMILYEIVCGTLPFEPEGLEGMERARRILDMQKTEEPLSPGRKRPDLKLPTELEALIMKALRKDPLERFQSMKEMEEALAAVPVPEETNNGRGRKEIRMGSMAMIGYRGMKKAEAARSAKKRMRLIAAVIAVAAAIAALSYALHPYFRDKQHSITSVLDGGND